MKKVGFKANPLPSMAFNKLSLIFRPEGRQITLTSQTCLFRRVYIPVLDGKISRKIRTADTTRRIGNNTEPLLAVLTPRADHTVFFFRLHALFP